MKQIFRYLLCSIRMTWFESLDPPNNIESATASRNLENCRQKYKTFAANSGG